MDLFNSLAKSHSQLVKQLDSLQSGDISQENAFSSIFDNLLFQMELEEQLLYEPLLRMAETKSTTEKFLKQQLAVKQLIGELFQDERHSKNLQRKVNVFLDSEEAQSAIHELFQGELESRKVQDKITLLQEAIKRHFEKEEKELFPLAHRLLPVQAQHEIKAGLQQKQHDRKQEHSVS